MTLEERKSKKLFSIEQANAALPLVRAIAADLARLSHEVTERRGRLRALATGRERQAGDPYDDEVAQVEEELQNDDLRLGEYVEELRQLGVEPKGDLEGLVDFPTMIDGREVCLCWKLGEPEVLYWHEREAGFAGRRALTAGTAAEDVHGEDGLLDL